MATWSLKIGGENKELAEWGVKNGSLKRVNMGIDTLTFKQPGMLKTDAPLFEAGATVELFRGEVRWFYGRAQGPRFRGAARRGEYLYELFGPWWYLEKGIGFRQIWRFRKSITDSTFEEKFNSYVLLGTKIVGTDVEKQSIGDQIKEAINYAISQGAPIQMEADPLGEDPYLPTLLPPSVPKFNPKVAEVIREMLRLIPDIVVFWDYSTTPFPTIRFRRRARQIEVTVPLDDRIVSDFEVREREDLQVPGVVIYYLSSIAANGLSYATLSDDIYPPGTTGRELKAVVAAINLEPTTSTYSSAQITCELINAGSTDWWKARKPNLAAANIKNLSITAPKNPSNLPNQLFGQYAPWMGGHTETVTIEALASYTEQSSDGNANKTFSNQPVYFTLLATDLSTGEYRSLESGSAGEVAPIGLAEAIFRAAGVLHYEGQITIQKQQWDGSVQMGQVLNLTGGNPGWSEMRAQITSVTEEIGDTGSAVVAFGPPSTLGPDDYIELIRAQRDRITIAPIGSRVTGGAPFASGVVLGEKIQREIPSENQGGITLQRFYDPSPPLNPVPGRAPGSALIDITQLDGKHAAFFEQQLCIKDADGNYDDNWFARVFMTAPYRR